MILFQRTERAPKDRNIAEVDPAKFAQMLIERLEVVLKEQEKKEKFHVTLSKVDQVGTGHNFGLGTHFSYREEYKNLEWLWGVDWTFCHTGNCLASRCRTVIMSDGIFSYVGFFFLHTLPSTIDMLYFILLMLKCLNLLSRNVWFDFSLQHWRQNILRKVASKCHIVQGLNKMTFPWSVIHVQIPIRHARICRTSGCHRRFCRGFNRCDMILVWSHYHISYPESLLLSFPLANFQYGNQRVPKRHWFTAGQQAR